MTLYPNGLHPTVARASEERRELLAWLAALPPEKQPRNGDEAVRLANAWLLARRTGCDVVEVA